VAELERSQKQVQMAVVEVARLGEERSELEAAMVQARLDLEEVRGQKMEIDRELAERGETSSQLREAAETQAAVVAEHRSRLAVMDERKETIERDLAGLRAQAEELGIRHGRVEAQIELAGAQKSEAVRSIADSTDRREDLTSKVAQIQAKITEVLASLETSRENLHTAEAAWDEARLAHDEWKDSFNKLQIERTEIDSDLKHMVSMCRSELGESIESVCLDSFATLDEAELETHDQEYQELRQKLDSMGNVNMMAVEEYEEAVQRFEFLTSQRQDLLDSIRDTRQAINEIDAVCRKQFAEAYAEVNAKFTTAFSELFGGGHGELRLIEEADDTDAGIEIIAQPPGKKLQNVLLLSGGEKALTALALLIALFRYRPSPFCVLDEVDAPLDDANIERFANMVRSMSGETQFIIITHSKRTMETASQLYGVTMEEAGVSKVVSVRFN
jgi:chromosome segregation protein